MLCQLLWHAESHRKPVCFTTWGVPWFLKNRKANGAAGVLDSNLRNHDPRLSRQLDQADSWFPAPLNLAVNTESVLFFILYLLMNPSLSLHPFRPCLTLSLPLLLSLSLFFFPMIKDCFYNTFSAWRLWRILISSCTSFSASLINWYILCYPSLESANTFHS